MVNSIFTAPISDVTIFHVFNHHFLSRDSQCNDMTGDKSRLKRQDFAYFISIERFYDAGSQSETDSSERQSLKLYAVITHWVVCQIPVKTLNYVGDWSLSFGRTMPLCKITRPSEQRKNLTALVF